MSNLESENLLMRGLANEDRSIIEKLYRDNFQLIRSLVLNNNGDEEDAADLFQEGMMVLFEKSRTEGFALSCSVSTFLYSVCRRLWLKKLQQNKKVPLRTDEGLEVAAVEEDIEHHYRKQEEFNVMEAAMEKIGEPCKSLLEAYYLEKRPMSEIAGIFGYTNADNAKTQKYKCLVRLKKLFFSEYKTSNI